MQLGRNNILLVVIFFSAMTPLAAQEDMIASITVPVTTEFGTYVPVPVEVIPGLPEYTLEDDFSNVVNFSDFDFTESELALLRQNYFVVSPRRYGEATGYKEMYDIYNECRELGIPIFVTSDALLHTFHLCFDFILKSCEEKRFIGDLASLLDALLSEATADLQAATTALARDAACININYLLVASVLLDSTFTVDDTILLPSERLYGSELALIGAAEEIEWRSPIFGYVEDYTQYKPRGHYTKSDSLKQYFRSMMWLGRMTFGVDSSKLTLAALYLTGAMKRATVNARPARQLWDDIYSPTVFFVGKSDDITFMKYDSLATLVYGGGYENLPVDSLADAAKLEDLQTRLAELPGPKITAGSAPKGMRLMGQRFIPDSWVMDELVFDKVPLRLWPTGLDVAAVLGSGYAYQLLEGERTMFPGYAARLDELRVEFDAYEESTWAQNLYWNWLYCLMPLFFEKDEGFPQFMRAAAWLDKDLFAALASWAELRHDTILYAKQSGSETSIKPISQLTQGYVEPNPWLYARLASLADFLQTGLESRDLLLPRFESSLSRLENLLLKLKIISEKELLDRSLDAEEYELICNIGETIETIVEFSEWPTGGPDEFSEDEMPVVADVHTEYNSGRVLEEGVGYPYALYAICKMEGELKIVKGAGFSYYEFQSEERLTDEQWRATLKEGTEPELPLWSASFIPDEQWSNDDPHSYQWLNMGLLTMDVSLSADSAKAGDPVILSLSSYCLFDGTPEVSLYNQAGDKIGAVPLTPQGNEFSGTIATTHLASGRYWLEIFATFNYAGLIPERLKYRTGFTVYPESGVGGGKVQSPSQFELRPNYPNPFSTGSSVAFGGNPHTSIRYELGISAQVTLEIFDVRGRKIRTLVSEAQPAGSYTAIWDGRGEYGAPVAAGVYTIRLKAGSFSKVQKMLLLH